MRRALTLSAARVLILIILAASAALLSDYTRPVAAFCDAGAGCEAVRASSFAYILGVPQPAFGLLAYMAVFALTFLRDERWRKLLFVVSSLGALFAFAFIGIQFFVIQRFCTLCMVVDLCAIVLAAVAWIHHHRLGSEGALPRWVWSSLAAVAVIAPLVFGAAQPDFPISPAAAQFSSPGKLTILELSDFACPFCRVLHPALQQALESYGDKVHVVRVIVPLSQQGKRAARAYACAKKQNRGDEMADRLFEAKQLSEEGHRAIASKLGMDSSAFDACFQGSEGQEAMMQEVELGRSIGFKGLPTTFIGTKTLVGAYDTEEIRTVIEEELKGEGSSMPVIPQVWLWVLMGATFLGAGLMSVLKKT